MSTFIIGYLVGLVMGAILHAWDSSRRLKRFQRPTRTVLLSDHETNMRQYRSEDRK